ncbi:DUF4407 domain-containing protein [Polaribacter glomeratus]|uniref:DUF4407 domain-containing protein n=1 Tax=Polaribacter glomeratus TaxID=102 RepID=A0A2S7WIJ5_9FLAO|nr:DUF4407 domain-containing protein [Polaribacter glomeratus]PQJ77414.1 hypothetical protein BTO16_16435 [Polaribacter glomeratus]TXD66000.1 DUF4407 domain-containing protein [Polaribacter glomeratus]
MLKKFFLTCAGVDKNIVENCGNGEQNKFVGIGATVFFTAVMATIAGSYALFTVFDNAYAAISFGLVWGLLIFNLDRFIVSTIKKTGSRLNELLQASPRIILAVIIAVVISKPLELKLFEKEINQVLLTEKIQMTIDTKAQIAQQFSPEIEKIASEISSLKQEITLKELETNTLYESYIAEAEGRKGTKKLGKGPVYQEKRQKHDASLIALKQLKIDNLEKIKTKETAIVVITDNQKLAEQKSEPIIANYDGLMARVNALGKLPWLPSFFIFLLFLAIETSPIIAKLLAPKGEYDFKLEDTETAIKTWVQQQVQQRKQMLNADIIIDNKVYKDISEEEELYTYKQKIARDLMKLQADSFYKKQQKML